MLLQRRHGARDGTEINTFSSHRSEAHRAYIWDGEREKRRKQFQVNSVNVQKWTYSRTRTLSEYLTPMRKKVPTVVVSKKMVPKESDTIGSCGFLATVCLWECSCWRKCVSLLGAFWDLLCSSFTQQNSLRVLPSDQDVVKAMSACMPPCSPLWWQWTEPLKL